MTRFQSAFHVSLYYALLFVAVGIHLPFWPVWLSSRGLTAAEIGIALATPYFGRALFSPIAGWVVDHLGERKRPLVIVAVLATVIWISFSLAHSFLSILIIGFFAAGLWACLMPLGDIIALASAAHWAFDYGRIRLWGSISFIAASAGAGTVLAWIDPSMLVWMIAGALGLTALSAALLPDLRPPRHEQSNISFKTLMDMPAFRWFLLTTALNQAGHTVLYGFATLHWQKAGLSSQAIGILWGEGVLAEIVLFAFAAPITRKVRPETLLLIAMLGGVVRWTALALTGNFYWLILFQMLHAATFCAAHLGAMYFLHKAIPTGLAARAQGLYSSIASGIMPGLMVPVAGWAYERFDGGAFLLMSATAAAGVFAATMLMKYRISQP